VTRLEAPLLFSVVECVALFLSFPLLFITRNKHGYINHVYIYLYIRYVCYSLCGVGAELGHTVRRARGGVRVGRCALAGRVGRLRSGKKFSCISYTCRIPRINIYVAMSSYAPSAIV
jgi:hypothetical protein